MKRNKDLILAEYIFTLSATETGKKFIDLQFPPLLDTPELRNGLRKDLYYIHAFIVDRLIELGDEEETDLKKDLQLQ